MWGRRFWPFPEHLISPRRGLEFTFTSCHVFAVPILSVPGLFYVHADFGLFAWLNLALWSWIIGYFKQSITELGANHNQIYIAELRKNLFSLHNGKSSGPDGILNELLKVETDTTLLCIMRLFNLIINSETVPSQWSSGFIVLSHSWLRTALERKCSVATNIY